MTKNANINTKNNILKKKFSKIFLGVLGVLLLCLLGLQFYGKHLISKTISKQLPENLELIYKDLDLNILFGNIEFKDLKLNVLNLKTKKTETQVTLEALQIKDLKYWTLWKNKQFNIDDLIVKNADIIVFKKDEKGVELSANNISFEFSEFKTDSILFKNKIPFNYKALNLTLSELFVDLSRFEILKIATLSYESDNLKFEDLSLVSKFNKEELSQQLKKERDYVNFKVPKGTSTKLILKIENDRFKISADSFSLNNSELHLFRDKLIADDTSKKILYGTKLKKLPFQLDIETFAIENATIFYSEKVTENIDPENISFEKLDARIDNLSNINNKKTTINATTKLMGKAPLEFNWSFNTSDPADTFNASAVLKDFDAITINPFLESQANVRALGSISEMYYTIYGNDFKSTGNMKMKYQNFEFSILNKDQSGINKTLSVIANIFTNDGSKADENGYRYGDIEVERDQTKSFFNYLWLNTKDGLKNTVVGNGKK